jgi:hypothetical protein
LVRALRSIALGFFVILRNYNRLVFFNRLRSFAGQKDWHLFLALCACDGGCLLALMFWGYIIKKRERSLLFRVSRFYLLQPRATLASFLNALISCISGGVAYSVIYPYIFTP